MAKRRLITISYTPLNAAGGVPRFNRDLHSAFPDRECLHFSWIDLPWASEGYVSGVSEWERARILNEYLVRSKKVTAEDVVIGDGFWCESLDHLPYAVSHSHGIWSHLTHLDVIEGKAPDMVHHHLAQVDFRRRWRRRRKHMTAVSNFIAEQMRLQWGFEVDRVINNGVDTSVYDYSDVAVPMDRSLVIHGVNDASNENKGWRHIKELEEHLDADVMSLDGAFDRFQARGDRPWTKPEVLAQADLVVHPSAFEGNSFFVAESLACGVPVVGYDVGFLYDVRNGPLSSVMDRSKRSPALTLETAQYMLADSDRLSRASRVARIIAKTRLDISLFREGWRSYIEEIEHA